jgi:6-phosphogluconolactonase
MARDYHAFVGTFTDGASEGVYTYSLDTKTGDLDRQHATGAGEDPTFLAIHPNGEHLYAINTAQEGRARAFDIDRESGALTERNDQPTGDHGPCYCEVDATGEWLLVAHYFGGSVAVLPIEDDGTLGPVADSVDHTGSSTHPERQNQPHPHAFVAGPDNDMAYAPDLGTDEVVAYDLDTDTGAIEPVPECTASIHDGAGPRHLDYGPEEAYAYLLNEIDSTLTVLAIDDDGTLDPVTSASTLPAAFDGHNQCADIHVHSDGEWVYASNRGHDSIARFDISAPERPQLVDHTSTRGEWPRHFALTPDGDTLLAENKNSDDIYVFRVQDDGALEYMGSKADVPAPVCVQLLEAP